MNNGTKNNCHQRENEKPIFPCSNAEILLASEFYSPDCISIAVIQASANQENFTEL